MITFPLSLFLLVGSLEAITLCDERSPADAPKTFKEACTVSPLLSFETRLFPCACVIETVGTKRSSAPPRVPFIVPAALLKIITPTAPFSAALITF